MTQLVRNFALLEHCWWCCFTCERTPEVKRADSRCVYLAILGDRDYLSFAIVSYTEPEVAAILRI